ncbi:MAG: helix-turn-helix domain-containing protein, partial [Methanomassiliicoccales archaeon]
RKWREEFNLSQRDLARELKVSASVISDYESGRRKSPGTTVIKRFVEALIALDGKNGGKVLRRFDTERGDYLLSIKEYRRSVGLKELMDAITAENISGINEAGKDIHGYTVLDSIKAITSLGASDFLKVFGWSSQRALVFTRVKFGRSPMIAVRAHPMKPAVVVYHDPENIDELAVHLSRLEGIPLLVTRMEIERMIVALERLGAD